MLRSERRVVITGLGLISPIGAGLDAFWSALAEGRGGIHRIHAFAIEGLPNDLGGEIDDFEAKTWFKKFVRDPRFQKFLTKNRKYMARA